MPIAYGATGVVAELNTAGPSISVPYPTGIAAGHFLVLFVASNSGSPANVPSGWTHIVSVNANTQSPSIRMFYKYATGSETGSLAVTMPFDATARGVMQRLTGVHAATPVDSSSVRSTSTTGTSYIVPGFTVANAGCALLAVGASNTAGGTWTPPTVPAQFTEVVETTGAIPSTTVAYLLGVAAGATGDITLVRSTNFRGAATVVALRPAPDGITGVASATAPEATANGSVTTVLTGGGAVVATTPTAAAAGVVSLAGAGAVTAPLPTAQGAGQVAADVIAGAGAAAASPATLQSAGTVGLTGNGSASGAATVLRGTGTVSLTSSGAAAAPPGSAAGVGLVAVTGAGAVASPAAQAAAVGLNATTGQGEPAALTPAAAGEGAVSTGGAGAILAPPAGVTGEGTVASPAGPVTGTLQLVGPSPVVVATGTVRTPLALRNITVHRLVENPRPWTAIDRSRLISVLEHERTVTVTDRS